MFSDQVEIMLKLHLEKPTSYWNGVQEYNLRTLAILFLGGLVELVNLW